MATISAITLTYNEEENIERCLKSLQWAEERIVIDTYSRDETLLKARPLCTRVIQHEMSDFSTLRNLGIKEAGGDWIFMVDADEVIPAELAEEIGRAIEDKDLDGYYINRINYMYGIRLHYDQPDYILRLFRKEKGIYKGAVHETAVVNGRVFRLKNSFLHYSMKNLDEHIKKMNLYTDLSSENADQNGLVLFLKPFYRLARHIFFKKAHREGTVGIILSLNAFFYEFINLFKVWEKRYIKRGWLDFYKDVDINKELNRQGLTHREFIEAVAVPSARRFLEVGSGAAAISMSILKNNDKISVITVDNNLDILKKVARDARALGFDIKPVCADALRLPFKDSSCDIVFSQGLLEHFCDSDIKRMLDEQLRVCSDSVFFSVPNNYYKRRDFGSERLLSRREWEGLLSGFDIAESKNYYSIRTKRNFLRSLPLMYMCRIKKRC